MKESDQKKICVITEIHLPYSLPKSTKNIEIKLLPPERIVLGLPAGAARFYRRALEAGEVHCRCAFTVAAGELLLLHASVTFLTRPSEPETPEELHVGSIAETIRPSDRDIFMRLFIRRFVPFVVHRAA